MTPTLKKLGRLLQRKHGVTSIEIIMQCGSTTPTRRMSDMRELGWVIKKERVPGKSYYRYTGTPPKGTK
jgi:hypothetical protein